MLKILQKDNSVVGADTYRDDTVSIPNAFRATLIHEINPNKVGTNNQVTVKNLNPVVVTIDGVSTAADTFFMSTKFSSLQHITNPVEREACWKNHMAYLMAAKPFILDGILPDNAITLLPADLAKY